MDDKLNYTLKKKPQTLTHFKLHFSVDSYSCFLSNPLTSSVLSLVFCLSTTKCSFTLWLPFAAHYPVPEGAAAYLLLLAGIPARC